MFLSRSTTGCSEGKDFILMTCINYNNTITDICPITDAYTLGRSYSNNRSWPIRDSSQMSCSLVAFRITKGASGSINDSVVELALKQRSMKKSATTS